jgi:hypothetical protein
MTESDEYRFEWLHADFEDHLGRFYFEACGFEATNAGLIALHKGEDRAIDKGRVSGRL